MSGRIASVSVGSPVLRVISDSSPQGALAAWREGLASDDVLVVVDAVTSLGGTAVEVDAWGADVCYSGTQKCLAVPPGLAPITFGPRAVERVQTRRTAVQSWYLDLSLITGYLDERAYHHTAPVSMLAGLHEGLRIVLEEGLASRRDRHVRAGTRLQAVLEDRGYGLFAAAGARLPQLTTALVPAGIDAAEVRRRLLMERNLEIGAGVGAHATRMWRIGLMGENATDAVVDVLLDALPG